MNRCHPERSEGSMSSRFFAALRMTIFACMLSLPANAATFQSEIPLENAVLEKEAQEIFAEIRCIVCDGESLATSNAEFSRDMRAIIRGKVEDGKTRQEVVEYLTSRYGSKILQRPPIQSNTYLLWLSPLILLVFGVIVMRNGRNRTNQESN